MGKPLQLTIIKASRGRWELNCASFAFRLKAIGTRLRNFTLGGRPMPDIQLNGLNDILAHNWWVVALRGTVGILFGLVAFVMPGATMLSLVLLFAAYMFADGILALVAAVRAARHHERWGPLTFEGVVDLMAAAVAALWPGITLVSFVLLVAAWALVSGALMIDAAFRLNVAHGRWWLALGGIASVLYGALLVIAPLIGAVVLTWWLGAYALVFGASLLVLAFRLRSRQGPHPTAAAAVGT
jgi:uncharacterized membrane protein HdeD (DUF308 family)